MFPLNLTCSELFALNRLVDEANELLVYFSMIMHLVHVFLINVKRATFYVIQYVLYVYRYQLCTLLPWFDIRERTTLCERCPSGVSNAFLSLSCDFLPSTGGAINTCILIIITVSSRN